MTFLLSREVYLDYRYMAGMASITSHSDVCSKVYETNNKEIFKALLYWSFMREGGLPKKGPQSVFPYHDVIIFSAKYDNED